MESGDRGDSVLSRPATPSHRKRWPYTVAAVSVHLVLASTLLAIAMTLPVDVLGIVAAAIVLLFLALVTYSFRRRFGREPATRMREGPVHLARGYMMFLSWAVLGYLSILLALGSELGPSTFILAFAGFWFLALLFLIAFFAWRRGVRQDWVPGRR